MLPAAATVAIAPILIGGEHPLKILEALAMRKAVVSTSRGCEGLSMIQESTLIVQIKHKHCPGG